MKAVMYHYVRVHDPALPNFRYLDVENFRRQLDYFEQSHGFLPREDWEDWTNGRNTPPSGKVVLTFDDAMSCHYDHVFPELCARGLWGIFYVPVQPYMSGRLLDVHQIHLLCGAYDGELLLSLARKLVTDEMVPFRRREEFRTETYTLQDNYAGVSAFKRLMNYFLAPQHRMPVLDELSEQLGYEGDETEFYVSMDALREMEDSDMIIGSHTVTHPVMSTVDALTQRREIVESFDFLRRNLRLKHLTYCHPYGGFHSFDETTIAVLDELDVTYSFNVEARDIEPTDIQTSRQHLPRYDCNLFPYGKAS